MATRKNHLFKFRRILLPVTAAGNHFSSYPAVYLRPLLRRKFAFLHFHRTLTPYPTAEILFFISLPYTCALLYGRNSFFYFPTVHLLSFLLQKFIFSFPCRTLTLFSTAEIRLSSFSTVHLRLTLRQKFIFSFPGRTLTLFSTAGFHLPWLSPQSHCKKSFFSTSHIAI